MFIGSRPDNVNLYGHRYRAFRDVSKWGLIVEEFYRIIISVDFDSLFNKFFQKIHFCSEQRLCLTEMTVLQQITLLLLFVAFRSIGIVEAWLVNERIFTTNRRSASLL
jgi:hypothetical protein